jgi:hypothetical protein
MNCESAGQSVAPAFLDAEEVRGSNPLASTGVILYPRISTRRISRTAEIQTVPDAGLTTAPVK